MKFRLFAVMSIVAALFCSCDGTLTIDEATELAAKEQAEIDSGKLYDIEACSIVYHMFGVNTVKFAFKDYGKTWRIELIYDEENGDNTFIKTGGQIYLIDEIGKTATKDPFGPESDLARSFILPEAAIRKEMVISNTYTESTKEINGKKCVCFTEVENTTSWVAGYKRLIFGSNYGDEYVSTSSFTEKVDESIFSIEGFTIL